MSLDGRDFVSHQMPSTVLPKADVLQELDEGWKVCKESLSSVTGIFQ